MTHPILILGGGTFYHVRNHLSIAAPAFGTTARWLHEQLPQSNLVLTKMADPFSKLETNADVAAMIDDYLIDTNLKAIIMNVAMCDYDGQIADVPSGKHAMRMKTKAGQQIMQLEPSQKVIKNIKEQRPDILLVGFKTTTHHNPEEQIAAAIAMGQGSRCDLVFANDTVTRYNLLVDANGTCLCQSSDRFLVLKALVKAILTEINE